MSRANANERYAYTKEGSSVFFTAKQNSFTGIENETTYDKRTEVKENEATYDSLTGVKENEATYDSFTGIKKNEATYDSLTGVKENEATYDELIKENVASTSNTKWIIIVVAVIISAIIIGGCIAAGILLTQIGDDNGAPVTTTTAIDTTKASTATSDTSYSTSTDSTTTGEAFRSQANMVGWLYPEDVRPTVWLNYDKVQNYSNICYYKVRLFDDSLLEIPVTWLSQPVYVYTTSPVNDKVRTIQDYLWNDTLTERCISAICDDAYAYLSAFDYRFNYKTYLYAADPFLTTNDPNLEFTIADDMKSLRSKMVRSPGGPFFENYNVCLGSSESHPHLRWYYDIHTGNWEVMRTFTLRMPPTDNQIESSRMTWYPFRVDGYKACYLKVRLEFFKSDVSNGMNLRLQLRTTSFGGAGGEVDGRVFGGRVTDIQGLENKTICIEFKCSGLIDPVYSTYAITDYTRVKVEFDHPISQMECTMTGSDGLSRNTEDDTQSGTIGGAYMFTADIASNASKGMYFATDNDNLVDANTNAINTCRAGGGAFGNASPLVGLGIMFRCRPK